jgi:thioesterase domain-containing protein
MIAVANVTPGVERAGSKKKVGLCAALTSRRLDELLLPTRSACSAADHPTFGKRVPSSQDAGLGWSRHTTGGVEVHVVPGDHVTMLRKPHVQGLAHVLSNCIAKACLP